MLLFSLQSSYGYCFFDKPRCAVFELSPSVVKVPISSVCSQMKLIGAETSLLGGQTGSSEGQLTHGMANILFVEGFPRRSDIVTRETDSTRKVRILTSDWEMTLRF